MKGYVLGYQREKTAQEKELEREYGWRENMGGGGGMYTISCLACSHFFSHNPSVLQSELFGRPGR